MYYRSLSPVNPSKSNAVYISTEKCDKVGYWVGPVWIAGIVCPVVLWASTYMYLKRKHSIGSSGTGFTPLSQPLATEQFSAASGQQPQFASPQPAAANIASPDWMQQQTMQPQPGAASL